MRSPGALLPAILVSVILAGGGGSPPAQEQGQFEQAKLEAFVAATVAVRRVGQEWNARIRAAESRERAAVMVNQASAEMAAVVVDTAGITIEEYQAIRGGPRRVIPSWRHGSTRSTAR